MAAAEAEAVGLGNLLKSMFIIEMKVKCSSLVVTTHGREQRAAGIERLKASIVADGFMPEFSPIVSLLGTLPGDGIEAFLAAGGKLSVIDGELWSS